MIGAEQGKDDSYPMHLLEMCTLYRYLAMEYS